MFKRIGAVGLMVFVFIFLFLNIVQAEKGILTVGRVSDNPKKPFLGSMGIYMFKTSVLLDLLHSTEYTDFGYVLS